MDRFLAKKSSSSVGSDSAAQPPLTANASSISSAQPALTPSSTCAAQPALSPSSTTTPAPSSEIGSAHDGCGVGLGSAEQPVVQFTCLKDVRRWMVTPEVLSSSLDVNALKEALTVLARVPKPRQEEVRPLQSKWDVAFRHEGKMRPLPRTHPI